MDITHVYPSDSSEFHVVGLSTPPCSRSNRRVPWHTPTHPQTKLVREFGEMNRIHSHRKVPLTFGDAVGLVMSNNCGLDEHFENLSRSKLPVLYRLDDLQA